MMPGRRVIIAIVLLGACRPAGGAPPQARAPTSAARPSADTRVQSLRITVLSTMLADRGVGEWGFAALVEADGRRILFDTGAGPNTVLTNAKELGVRLDDVDEVVLSHHHDDHVGGLLALREAVRERAPRALSIVHVAAGMFEPRHIDGREVNAMPEIRSAFEATGGSFVIHDGPAQLAPGVWLTGPVPRIHDERNWSGRRTIERDGRWVEDDLPEDMSLVLDTDRGLVVLAGCGHAGLVNTIAHARASIRGAPIHAAIGGFHLLDADDAKLAWTAEQLDAAGLARFYGGHCTGIEAVYRFRELLGLPRAASLVAAVGGTFTLADGIVPGALAH
jgi:7,8-dihydropterin-6-yl-methyl-4-(beta-D-ribofuranosyl)aminobenzene 5'-phosphate synthase